MLHMKISKNNIILFIIETQTIIVTATNHLHSCFHSMHRCTGIYKFGNKYLPSAYRTQFEFRSHFSGEKVRLIGREIR
jgi:hypothetical protein